MTKEREALKLALEALEKERPYLGPMPTLTIKAITAIREALAQPYPDNFIHALMYDVARRDSEEQQQEPVAWMHPDGRIWTFGRGLDKSAFTIPLYTTPPHRKPLTEKRIEELYSFWVVDCQDIVGFARAVERTVKGEV